jgi:type I restriction enzyme S subunit
VENLYNLSRGGTQKFISLKNIREFVIPIPPISFQKEMAKQYEEYIRATNLNRKLITEVDVKMQNKIKKLFE